MVRLAGFAAINEEGRVEHDASQQTIEALESRVIDEYERALREIQANNLIDAETAFRSVLADQLVIDGATEQLQRLRFLSLKNLAGVITSPSRAQEALKLYALAAREDASDVALWDKYGTLAAETGEWAAAKSAFEEALSRDPRHPTVSSKLLQILVHVGDTARADGFAKFCLEQDPWHPLARRVVKNKTGEEMAAAGTDLVSLPPVYGGPATPDSSRLTLFPTQHVATVALDKASWIHLLRKCIKLLANPLAAVANVKFVAPQTTEAVTVVASPAAAAAAAVPTLPAPTVSPTVEVQKPPAQPSEDQPAAKYVVVDAGAQQKLSETKDSGEPLTSPQRRSVRSTKSKHKSQQSGAQLDTKSTPTDPFNLLRTLAPSLCPPHCPESAQLAEKSKEEEENKAVPSASGSKAAEAASAAIDESLEVHSCQLLNVSSIPAVQAAITLVLHFTQPQHAARLPQLTGSSGAVLKLVSMLEKQQQWKGQGMTPEQYLIVGELFSDAATAMMRATAANSIPSNTEQYATPSSPTAPAPGAAAAAAAQQQNTNELNLAEFQRGGALWLSRFRASHLTSSAPLSTDNSTATASTSRNKNATSLAADIDGKLIEARYWWARGRLCEAASKPTEAFECYSQCSALLFEQQQRQQQEDEKPVSKKQLKSAKNATKISYKNAEAAIEIKLPHCCLDATITPKSVQAKLELLQLHGVLTKAEYILLSQQPGKHAEAAAILAPVSLACSDTEGLMAAVDRPTWIKALRTLRNAAVEVQDVMLALRCHLRLLRAGLPRVPSTIEAVLQDPENDQEISGGEAHLAITTAHFFIDTQHFVATGAAADLAAAATFLGNFENFEKIKSILSTSDTVIDSIDSNKEHALHPTFELHALRMLIKQNLALVHSCGAALHATPDRRSTMNTRAVVLRHSMADAAVVGMQLWYLDTASKCTPGYVLEWCYGLTDALAEAGALTERHGALPALVLPHLQHALATAESMLESQEKHNSKAAVVPSKKKKTAAAIVSTSILTDDEVEELKDVVESLKCGIDNCLLWLYGVRLPGVDEEEWGGSVLITSGNNSGAGTASTSTLQIDTSTSIFIPPGGLRPLASQEAALAMWPSVSDHLVGQSVSALQKHKGFLENMLKLFPGLPPAIQFKIDAAWEQITTQEPPELDGQLELKFMNPIEGIVDTALLELVQQQAAEGKDQSSFSSDWIKYLPIYRTLFHLVHLVQAPTPVIIDQAGFSESLGILDPSADSLLSTKVFAPLLADLAINPSKYPDRWSSLALLYHEAADLILIKAAHEVPTRQWLHRADLHRRVNLYRRLGHWCTVINALCLVQQHEDREDQDIDTNDEKVELLELSGSKRYDEVNDVPPQYNQLDIRPARDDPALVHAIGSALRAYQSASEILPDEYAFKMNIGRCLRRLGRAPKEYLPMFARACQLAMQHHNGGLVDPVYTLHNARMKLVQQAQREVSLTSSAVSSAAKAILFWVGKYCFSKETQDKLKEIYPRYFDSTENSISKMSEEQAMACCTALLSDCTASMEWCLEKQKGYHRASLALAKVYAAQGNYELVVKQLSPLFSKYKVLFSLNMSPIVATTSADGGKKQKRRNNNGGGADKTNTAAVSGGGGGGTPIPNIIDGAEAMELEGAGSELESGICPAAKNIGIGVLESEVAFISRVRKAMHLYLTALVYTGARDILAAADQFFDNVKLNKDAVQTFWMSKPGFEDIRKLAKGFHVLSLLSSAFEICPLVSVTLPPEEEEEREQARQVSLSLSPNKLVAMRHTQARNLSKQHRHLRSLAGQLDPTAADPVLQEVYKLWSEHTGLVVSSSNTPAEISTGGGIGGITAPVAGGNWWEPSVAVPARFALNFLLQPAATPTTTTTTPSLPHAESLGAVLQGSLSQTVAQTYSQLYIHLLAVHGGTEKIKSMLAPLKRRFRKIKLCADEPRKLVIQLCSAGVGSLVAETKELLANAALIAPVLAQPAEPLQDLAETSSATGAAAAGAAAAAAVGVNTTTNADGGVLQAPKPAPSPSRPTLPPPPPVPAAAMIPTTLNQAQMQILQQTALNRCQQYVASVIQENAARGINLPLTAVQYMQERRYTQEVAELQRQAITQLTQARNAAHFQHSEAMRQYTLQVKLIEQAHQRAVSGFESTAPSSHEEQELQEKVIQAMQQLILFIRAAPWLGDEDTLPSLKSAKAGADDLRIELLRCYLVLGHYNLPTTRQQALRMCDEVIKLHKKGIMAAGGGGGGGGGGGSRPASAAAVTAPVPATAAVPVGQVNTMIQTTAPQNTAPAPGFVLPSDGQTEPTPKRQRVEEPNP